MNGRLLTAEEVAALLSLPTTWVYAAARRGEIPSVPLGRYVRFDEHDIAAWIATRKTTNGRETR